METKSTMLLCSLKVANELIAKDENFKYVIVICPWLGDKASDDECVLAVDKHIWKTLIDSGEVYLKAEVAGVKKNEDD
jgi:hypothetical protein